MRRIVGSLLSLGCFVEPDALAFGSSGPLLAEHLQSLACIVYELVAQPLPVLFKVKPS